MYENDREFGRNFGADVSGQGGGNAMMAFGIGMVAGAITAMLLTPQTGPQMRGQLKRVGQKVGEKAKSGFEQAKHVVEQQKDRFSHAVDEGRQTYQREASASTTGSSYGTTGTSGTPTTGNRGL
jgi:gas vesicle protein